MVVLQKDFLPEDLKPVLQKNNIEGTIVVQALQDERETDFLLKLATENSFIKGVVGWTNLNAPDVEENLDHLSQNIHLKGFRHTIYDEKGEFLKDPSFQNGISHLKVHNFTFDLLVFDYQLNSAVDLVEKFPDQPFVLDHLAKAVVNSDSPSHEWIKNMSKLAGNENVYAKLSGILNLSNAENPKKKDIFPFLDVLLDAFGAGRLMFGSDWPVCNIPGNYEAALNLVEEYFSEFHTDVKEKIFGGNAMRFYNL